MADGALTEMVASPFVQQREAKRDAKKKRIRKGVRVEAMIVKSRESARNSRETRRIFPGK
jgi:hypothetical protein